LVSVPAFSRYICAVYAAVGFCAHSSAAKRRSPILALLAPTPGAIACSAPFHSAVAASTYSRCNCCSVCGGTLAPDRLFIVSPMAAPSRWASKSGKKLLLVSIGVSLIVAASSIAALLLRPIVAAVA
jgi:hypothetical protein